MASVCDWRGRESTTEEFGVDDIGNRIHPGAHSTDLARPSLMHRMVEISDAQLRAVYTQNVHSVSATTALVDWLNAVQAARGRPLRQREASRWQSVFGQFYEPMNRGGRHVNEGGFVIRFIVWLQPRLQRPWYLKVYGKVLTGDRDSQPDLYKYAEFFLRPALPRTMSAPAVPSILPFNTVSFVRHEFSIALLITKQFIFPLSPRMIRLISHRNALRISFTALSQPWLPKHVYPPPPPPLYGVLNIAYVTNDVK